MSRARANRRRTARKPRAQRRVPVHWTQVLALATALTMLVVTFFAAQARCWIIRFASCSCRAPFSG